MRNSIINGLKMQRGDLNYDWQEFARKRQDRLEEKIHIDNLSSEYTGQDNKLDEILQRIGDENLIEEIHDAAFSKERIASYIYYNAGFREGLKLALKLSEL